MRMKIRANNSLLLGVLLYCTMLFSSNAYAQYLDDTIVEKKTYTYYLSEKWDSLYHYGQIAVDNGYDYYYLRMRLGIAAMNLNQSHRAVVHFKKALVFNPGSIIASDYLRGAYSASLRDADVQYYGVKFYHLKEDKIKKIRLEHIFFEAGGGISDRTLNLKGIKLAGRDDVYGEENLGAFRGYSALGGGVNLGAQWKLNLVFSGIAEQREQHYRFQKHDTVFDSMLSQWQSYAALRYRIIDGLSVTAASHVFGVQYYQYNMHYNEDEIQPGGISNGFYELSKTLNKTTNYAQYLGVQYYVGDFFIDAGVGHAELFNKKQWQYEMSLFWYPLHNSNLYAGVQGVYFTENRTSRWIPHYTLGAQIVDSWWIEGTFAHGELSRSMESAGFIIYNKPEKLWSKAGVNLNVEISDHIIVSLRYTMERYSDNIYQYSLQPQSIVTKEVVFNNHSLIGGVKWLF